MEEKMSCEYFIDEVSSSVGVGHVPLTVRLGSPELETKVQNLLSRKREGARVFVLSWEGNLIPRGAVVMDREIVWIQHGVVMAAPLDPGASDDEQIGSYSRLVEWGGESGKEQKVLLFIDRAKLESRAMV